MELIWYIIILLIVLGFLVGTISSIAGIGGGGFFVPIMVLIFLTSISFANMYDKIDNIVNGN